MSNDNLNISFDKSVEEGDYIEVYKAFCDNVTDKLGEDKERYDRLCLKLMRNLDPYVEVGGRSIIYSDRCSNVNNWFYYTIDKKKNYNKDIIYRIFDLSRYIRSGNNNYGCTYYSYDTEYKDPINTIHLKIFNDNIDVIKNTLMGRGQENNKHCQKYVCECVNIYHKMNKSYCSGPSAQPHKHQKTCDMLKTLKQSYNMFLFDNSEIRSKIPSLEAIDDDLLAKCPSIQSQHSLQAVADDHSGSSTSKIPATIGTMAGVSSVFALLYKLTPAGRWINTGLRGNGGRTNNSLYTNGADDLILDGLEHNNFNSYNIGYEAA
ncbi:VIR protein [Plasmodium vivax]|uniref:VIR protein n=1 Tax=Plasmodium vivax TaxID=5855 RepID=A0A1G4GSB5_PLAVI|nr:VIR protein [Plasmodium vivax]